MVDAALAVSFSQPAGVLSLAILAVSGLAVFVAPGALLLAGFPLRWGERLGFAFAASLVLLTATFALCLLGGTSIAAAPAVLATVTVAATLLVRRVAGSTHDEDLAGSSFSPGAAPRPAGEAPLFSRAVLATLTCAFVAAAIAFAPVGSVDRWWYLAYVRGFLEGPALTLAEPFLGTGQVFARFGVHPWLFGLATWSWLSGMDPVVVYQLGAPGLVVLASVSASWVLAREMFGDGTRVRLCVLATMLLWSGGMVPLLARAGEDKVLAAAALIPLCIAAFLRSIRAGGDDGPADSAPVREQDTLPRTRPWFIALLLLSVAAVATAAVHALAYAFVLVALLPTAMLLALRGTSRRRAVGVAVAVLLVIALAPALSGIVVRERLAEIGAGMAAPDHPVVRVHEGRNRLIELPAVGYVVTPWLLLHPITLLALAGALLWSRRARDATTALAGSSSAVASRLPLSRGGTTMFLAATTVVPLAIAFVPPLPLLAGAVIPPWMVYRVLWLLPLAPLAAVAADVAAKRFGRGESAAVLLLLALGLPVVADGARARLTDVRGRMSAPDDAPFRGLVAAAASLPADALVVAAPELSERLPAFVARPVVAALDRSTIVFTGSRERGEARLRARAALLVGDPDGFALARAAGLRATHAVYDPAHERPPLCGPVLYRDGAYALCALAGERNDRDSGDVLEASTQPITRTIAEADCGEATSAARRNPWAAAAPIAVCRIEIPGQWRGRDGLHVVFESETGRAADELRVVVVTAGNETKRFHTTVRATGRSSFSMPLPPLEAESIEIHVASSFLPVVRARRVSLATR